MDELEADAAKLLQQQYGRALQVSFSKVRGRAVCCLS
jgi:hypothetical protein